MDESFVELQGSHGIPLALPSKCAGSISPAIDLNRPMDEIQSPPKHEHFSIRGFVAEMRKKDKKVCLPFATEGGDDMSLPPMFVPKFRQWQCSKCVPDILNQKSMMQMILSNKSDAGTSSFPNLNGEKDRLLVKNIAKNPTARPQPKLRSMADIIRDDKNLNHPSYLEASSDALKAAAKTPQRKRTRVLKDDEEMVLPPLLLQGPAKTFKGPVAESENNTCNDNDTITIVEISDSESEEDNSLPIVFGSRLSGKGHQNKVQKQSFIDQSLSSYTGSEMNLEKQESSGRHTGIPDLNEPFVETETALHNGARHSGVSSSKKSFSQVHKGNTKAADLAGPSSHSVQPPRSNLNLEVCTLNRNPADFSIPDARNEFTIGAKDLKPKKRNPPKVKSQPGNVEGSKKQRVRKGSSRKGLSKK